MKVTVKKLSELRHPDRNVRLHTDRQIKEFKRSLDMFGQIRPMVIDEDGVILAGNGLYEALKEMGRTEADCYVMTGLTGKQKKKLMLADNKIYTLGVDDTAGFDAILQDLGDDIEIPGFDDDLLRTLTANQQEIDRMLSDYGTLTEQSNANIQGHAAVPAAIPLQPADSPAMPPPEQGQVTAAPQPEGHQIAAETPAARYIICPSCGERILL